ncbi:MAG: hypothetical protein LBS69_06275 [Prevotellaceae bacterium]|nr:hypothetical protein [Prevotellaceae bacterium]
MKQNGKIVNVYYLDGELLFSGSKTQVAKKFKISSSTMNCYIKRGSFYSHRYLFSTEGFVMPKNSILNKKKTIQEGVII